MKLASLLVASLALAPCLCLAQGASAPGAGTSADIWKAVRDKQPEGLRLNLTLPKTHFYRGEFIPAELVHTNSSGNPYYLWIGTYDRSGRLPDISFAAIGEEGKPVADPLEYYFTHYAHVGGGLGNYQNLGRWELTLAANPWLRFDKPGKYRLYARTTRVRPGEKDALREREPNTIALVSDPVEITIEPLPPEAAATILARAQEVKTDIPPMSQQNEADAEAVQRLRFLDTPAAREALARFLDSPYGSEAIMGFYSSGDYQGTAAWLLDAVREGRLALSPWVEGLYVNLKTGGMDWPLLTPDGKPIKPAAPSPQETLYAEAKRGLRDDGTGDVYFTSLLTLFRSNREDPQIRAIMIRHQLDLPEKQIREAFQQKGLLVDKDFLPLLRSLVTPEQHNGNALAVLAALAPDEARPIVIEDIRRPQPIYLSAENYASARPRLAAHLALPDKELPELDDLLRERLPRSTNNLFDAETVITLIERYASKALLPDVKKVYLPTEGHWACAFQTDVLRYWIRCDPVEGVEALRRALAKNGKEHTGCYHTVLENVLNHRWVPEALPLVLEATRNNDAEVVRSATAVLKRHSGQESVDPLITAAEALAARPLPSDVSVRDMQLYVPREIIEALLGTKGWKLDRGQLERLLKVARDPNQQAELKQSLGKLAP